jgi:hypothetical protein
MDNEEQKDLLNKPKDSGQVLVEAEPDEPLNVEQEPEEPSSKPNVESDEPVQKQQSVTLELGDIIEIIAPSNQDVHEMTALITYRDRKKIKLIDVASYKKWQLNITDEGRFTDESIIQIHLLHRNDEKGYARQNGLTPGKWINISFGGEIPTIISGEISNLDEDMMELTTYPGLQTIYIDFKYQGIPDDIPIEKIEIRKKPASLSTVGSLAMLREQLEAEGLEEGEIPEVLGEELATMEYTETGEAIIKIPEGAKPDEDVRDALHDMYIDADTIVYGEKLEKIVQLVEVPEGQQRYGIDAQVNDMMDELLSTIPNSQRNKAVLDNIHILIERFKELRTMFSKFDINQNVYAIKTTGAFYKPLIEHIERFDKKLQWLVPVVSTRRKIYDVTALETDDVTVDKLAPQLREMETLLSKRTNALGTAADYSSTYNRIQEIMTPIELPLNEPACLTTASVLTNIESIVDNLEEFYSSVYVNGNIKRQKYVIQRYNLGLPKMNEEILKTGKKSYTQVDMTPNDKMCVKSLIMMPEEIVKFSNIELPTTNILEKASYHQNYFLLFRLLRKNTDIIPHVIDDLEKELDYELMEKEEKVSFLSGIQEFILDKELYVSQGERFHKFLEAIIPKTRFLVKRIRKYITDKITFIDVVKELEPFMVYPSDISYKQFMEIRFLMKERIIEVKKAFEQRYTDFSNIRNAKYVVDQKMNTILRLLSEKKDFADAFFETYKFLAKDKMDTKISSYEILFRMTEMDNANLYTNILTSIMMTLMTPDNLLDALSEPALDDLTDNEKIKPKDCTRRYLAKKYSSVRDLQKDNNVDEVFFDKDFDDTPYDILKRYEKQRKEMLPELFLEYLTENLIQKHDCPKDLAPQLAKTLIEKKKPINDGDYAILEIKPTLPAAIDETKLSESEREAIEVEADIRKKTSYYKRLKDVWVADNEINSDAFLDTNTLFCNISATCFKNTKNAVCETTDDAAARMREQAKKSMMGEFDKRYAITIEELEKTLEKNIEYYLKMLKKNENLKEIQAYRANNLAFSLGSYADTEDLIFSPYLKLRDMILGQAEFSKKQSDICRFVDKFCREPMIEQLGEHAHWYYCKETNTKLFPKSIFELAECFVSGGDYAYKLDEVSHYVGITSDDGDSVVDKYSGFIIRKKDLSNEEGRDEAGFKMTSRDILEKDLGAAVQADAVTKSNNKKTRPVFESETVESIYNIMSGICGNIDIPIDDIKEFIQRTSNAIIEKEVFSEEMYKKKSDQQFKKTGKGFKTSYVDYSNETMITIIAGVLLIAVQTAIPSFQVKRTFPGCIRSFSGYPMTGIEDLTGIQYLACVLSKMKLSQDPWKSISKYKADTLTTRIKTLLENNIMTRPDIEELYVKKREYLILNPTTVIPEEHSIQKWKNFLPPIVPFEVLKSLKNLSSDFVSELDALIHRGSEHQSESIMALRSKGIFYGYGIIEAINDIVKSKDAILKTAARVPFVENACCNENIDATNPIAYFNNENKNIEICIKGANQVEKLLKYVKILSNAYFLYHPEKTGITHPTVQIGHFEENTYLAIIRYCNFDRNLPIPEEYKIFCSEKPDGYQSSWSLEEKKTFLKKTGKHYEIEDLQNLMKIVNQHNLVTVAKPEPFTQVDVMRDILEKLDMMNSTIIAEPLRNLIHKVLEKYNPLVMSDTASKELDDLTNYLIINNSDIYKRIMKFFDEYAPEMSNTEYQKLHGFLSNIDKWTLDRPMTTTKSYYDEGLYAVTQFIINALQMVTKVYPSVLLNDSGFYKNIPKHWGLSSEHVDDISKFINKYYEEIEKFKEDAILVRLLKEVGARLTDLNLFVDSIPLHTEVVKEFPDDDSPGQTKNKIFHSIFDKTTVYELYKYCFFSALFEYISACGDVDLVRADKNDKKSKRRTKIAENMNEANSLYAVDDNIDDLMVEEVEIVMDNPEDLKSRVCSLLLSFLNIEEKNKASVDFTYEQILKRVGRSKDKEKQAIIKKLGNMSIEERSVENMLKNYRLERWNVGQQKGLIQYDKDTYNRERDEMLQALDEEMAVGFSDEANMELLDIYELGKKDAEQADADDAGVGRDDYDFRDMGVGFMDGDYYGDEGEDDFPED